jgi:hypothetical protein
LIFEQDEIVKIINKYKNRNIRSSL